MAACDKLPVVEGVWTIPLIVYGQNGEPIRPENGFPLRHRLNPGFQGMRNVKYIERIKVVDQPYYTTLEAPGYTDKWPSLNGKARAFPIPDGAKVGNHLSFRRASFDNQGVL